jgi:prolyl-tRNA editing enzyme YbaK/EbsC (Cys-tRNA(Pro) deacylase)
MSLASVKEFFAQHAPELEVLELPVSTATVEEAARGHGVAPGQIAKTISLKIADRIVLIVTAGDRRLDNKKMKSFFGGKASMLSLQEAVEHTGHPIGGVCPFGLAKPLEIFLDHSLKDWDIVVPAAGAINAAVKITPDHMQQLTNAQWADLCKDLSAEGSPE